MLPLPVPATDDLKLADWLETLALISDDGNSSIGDLERALHRSSVLEMENDQDSVERKCLEVRRELEDRATAAEHSYPFNVDGALLSLKSRIEDFPAYIFCLCLSSIGLNRVNLRKVFPARMFERLACVAARNYLGGDGIRFASPREELPKNFRKAVDSLCIHIGEGKGYRNQPTLARKDDTLDIVAWKHFSDTLPGKLILFGQCASGANWDTKVTELQPETFCGQWMIEPPPLSYVTKAFFIPHRIERNRWELTNRRAGIIFDRCRLSYWVHQEKKLKNRRELMSWCKTALGSVKSN